MSLRFLFTSDPVAKLDPEMDFSVLVAEEVLKRHHQAYFLDITQLSDDRIPAQWLAELPVQQILSADGDKALFFEVGPKEKIPADTFQVMFHRKDPPVNEKYIQWHKIFTNLDNVMQVNDPHWICNIHEHEFPLEYPEYSVPTLRCENFEELVAFVRKQEKLCVCKPLSGKGGESIEFFTPDASEGALKEYWDKTNTTIIAQQYIDEIENSGDLRIMFFDEDLLGSVLRVPQTGSRLANLHQGAMATKGTPTPRQIEICHHVGRDLMKKNIHLMGFDFIGDYLTEVNITSPTLLKQINQVQGIESQALLIDSIEKKLL